MQATTDRKRSILDKPVLSHVTFNWELLLIIAIVLLAIGTRYYDLGTRALHHDESIHARWSWDLYQTGSSFRHDPTYHGPWLYYAVDLAFLLFGATDFTTRVAPAFFGVLLVLMPLLLRKQLGRVGVIATMLFIVLSPSIMYYSRALRHDIFALFGTMAMVVAIFRYLDDKQPKWLYFFTVGFTISYTSHELTFITGYILLGALAIAVIHENTRLWPLAALGLVVYAAAPAINLPIAMVLLALPVGAFLVMRIARGFGIDPGKRLEAGVITRTIAGIAGHEYAIMALIWAAIAVPLFTTMFNWLPGLSSGTIGAITYWLSQHGVARGSQPGYYYLVMLPIYEFLPLIFASVGFIYWAVKRWRNRAAEDKLPEDQKIVVRHFPFFLFYWFLASLILYSWAGEKMPWLVMHITLPLCVLAGWFVDKFLARLDLENLKANGGLAFAGIIPLFVVLLGAVLRGRPQLGATGLAQQTQTIQWLAMAVLLIAAAGAIGWLWTRLGSRAAAQVLGLVVLAVLSLFTIRAAWMASYAHGDIAKDMLVYVQSTRDVTNVVDRVNRLSQRMTSGKDLVISYDDESSWPLTWYFRDYKNQKFEPKGPTAVPDTPVVMVGLVNDDKVKPLMGNYTRTHLKLRWWFPEFYKSADETARTFLDANGKSKLPTPVTWGYALRTLITDPVARSRVWRFWLYRDLWDPNTGQEVTYGQLGSTDFVVYVRKDLSDSFWSGGPAVTKSAVASVESASYERAVRQVASIGSFGGQAGAGNGQMSDPKNVAVDAAGNVYVADTLNHRVQKFDAAGAFVMAFGSQGAGDGQFSEPWGIAVDKDGYIYVCDTWNHRIQKFDKDGKFVTKWGGGLVDTRGVADGQPGVFYGPRAVIVDNDGNLLVSDTGNKRIQKFDKDGKFIAQFGVVGTLDGQFNEQVGIAIDRSGNVYVADTWNHRIQKFDASFKCVSQWPVLGWDSESIVNKPYLATDSEGNVYATDPEAHRVLKFSPTGSILAIWGQYGNGATNFNLPVGIAVDSSGNVYVADALNQRVLKFAPVK